MANMILGSVLAAAIAAAVGCGSGPVADYENCGAISQFGECAPTGGTGGPGSVCAKACDCLAQIFPELGDVEGCVAECVADPDQPSRECAACIQANTCEVILVDGGPCDVACAEADQAADPG